MSEEDRNGNGIPDRYENYNANDTNGNAINDRRESQFSTRPDNDYYGRNQNYNQKIEEWPSTPAQPRTESDDIVQANIIKSATRFFTYTGIAVLGLVALGLALTSIPVAIGLGLAVGAAGGVMGYKYFKNRNDQKEAQKNEPMGPMPGRPQVLIDDRDEQKGDMEMTFTKEKAQDGRTQDNHSNIVVGATSHIPPISTRRAIYESQGRIAPQQGRIAPQQGTQREQSRNMNTRRSPERGYQ